MPLTRTCACLYDGEERERKGMESGSRERCSRNVCYGRVFEEGDFFFVGLLVLGVLVGLKGEHTAEGVETTLSYGFCGLTFYQVIIIGEWVVSFGLEVKGLGGRVVCDWKLNWVWDEGEESSRKLWDVPCVSSARCEGLVGGEY
ncbi:hypothetical protein BO83DRAFT_99262 [Aspergillus eucalypticola CBS 122712]|uniref:Uncharacterized protein n=1 Tax=Aspergillus eucalypticola (strain CBS 122712 / IBT 29274) TaxID=1448314 RepID=A0A317V097_ASPEC|nr:uncharacterized protein BO83DRAFT_99262 [Aspergillus eucalypticola CBS 122712]PWY67396.1 hypothetical protein BO83DRAFT_99262 [Aspergillus eucalypticola CBS 122712]